ncbi:hypothetical protein [Salsipaludibacter albus]|uniref:hypothetical protein n=1 Tax=Salsipaludibacter albus TaxID=2849650 RepID=UPI001EE422C1|nr:hypothetical protein [Salsipaludibacter albus]MBY5161787.1 hypothetical protein [Salsipaludibacter albus]
MRLPGLASGRRAGSDPASLARRDRALLRLRTGVGGHDLDDHALADLEPDVADMVGLARACGAPLQPVVAAALDGAERRRRVADERLAAIAPARTVARSLLALPILAVPGLAAVTGVDLGAFFLDDPLGRIVLGVVAVLLAVAWLWMRAILSRADRPQQHRSTAPRWLVVVVPLTWWLAGPVPGVVVAVLVAARMRPRPSEPSPHLPLATDLVAVAVSAGHDLPAALRLAGDRLDVGGRGDARHDGRAELARALRATAMDLALRPELPADGRPRDSHGEDRELALGPLGPTVRDLATTGAPGAPVLRDLANRLRADDAARERAAVARLPARLTFPTALVLVPATVLAIGAPIVLDGLARVAGP